MSADGIVIKDIVKLYPRQNKEPPLLALDHVSITVPAGKFVSIIGESGCGKTTLLRMVAGLDKPTEGTIHIDGIPVSGPNPNCGMMFQQDVLFPWLTVRENIAFGPKMLRQSEAKKERVEELLRMIHIEEFAKDYPGQLSGGMKQRVSLARALANEPAVLLLDEPLGALDAFTRMHIQDELLEIRKKYDSTMLMITHDIDEAVYLSDIVVVMTPRPGRVNRVIPVDMPHPRNRSAEEFVEIRNLILRTLHYATE